VRPAKFKNQGRSKSEGAGRACSHDQEKGRHCAGPRLLGGFRDWRPLLAKHFRQPSGRRLFRKSCKLAFAEPFIPAFSPPAMIIPGQFNVDSSGAFTYSIPIAVPPGIGGMVPALSLN
jgi:hypothetical protein